MKENRFAENLKYYRDSIGWTQDQLGKMLGVDQRTISNWGNKISEPDLEMLLKLSDLFDENLDELISGKYELRK